MQIHELPTTDISNTDKIAFDTGTNTFAGQFINIANSVLAKLPSITFSTLTTTAKNVIDAINELKSAVDTLGATYTTTTTTSATYGSMSVTLKRRGKLVSVSIGGAPEGLTKTNVWYSLMAVPSQYVPANNGGYNVFFPQGQPNAPFLLRVSAAGNLDLQATVNVVNTYINATYWYFID